MNAEQKQRAIKLITYWRNRSITTMPEEYFVSGDCMTDLLQELIDAPEPEPVAYQVRNGWVNIALYERQIDAENYAKDQQKRHDLSGSLAYFCVVPLYTAPPANNQSEQHLVMVNAPAPSVPDADLVRDAERWLSEHDLELLVTFGMQADDCDADGHTLSKEQTRRLCELGVLRNVGFGRHEMTAFGDSIFGVHFSQGISLPLHTHAEYNAAIERNKQKGGEA